MIPWEDSFDDFIWELINKQKKEQQNEQTDES
jgi:predicted CopG family antitoxin